MGMFVSFTAGIRGCWKTSPSNITASAILMLIACLFHAGGMGLWHGVEHWENEKIKASSDSQSELFKLDWSWSGSHRLHPLQPGRRLHQDRQGEGGRDEH